MKTGVGDSVRSGESMAMLVICISAAHGDRGDGQHEGGTWDMMVEVLEKCVQDRHVCQPEWFE